MKKWITLVLAVLFVLSLATSALAAGFRPQEDKPVSASAEQERTTDEPSDEPSDERESKHRDRDDDKDLFDFDEWFYWDEDDSDNADELWEDLQELFSDFSRFFSRRFGN